MKNTIFLLKKIALISCVFINIFSGVDFETWPKASPNVTWNFELYNKSGHNIIVAIDAKYWSTSSVLPPLELKKGIKDPLKGEKLRIANVDPSNKIKIKIWLDTVKNKDVFNEVRKVPLPPKGYVQRAKETAQNWWNFLTLKGGVPSDIEYEIKMANLMGLPLFKQTKFGAQYHTMFLTFDEYQRLRPQTGILGGKGPSFLGLKKTDSGLDNSNNIDISINMDIIKRTKP